MAISKHSAITHQDKFRPLLQLKAQSAMSMTNKIESLPKPNEVIRQAQSIADFLQKNRKSPTVISVLFP